MIFSIINVFISLFLIFESFTIDKQIKIEDDGSDPIMANVLLLAITSTFYTLFSIVGHMLIPSLFTILMKLFLSMEGCLLVNISFCFTYYAWKYSTDLNTFIKLGLYVLITVFVFKKFGQITISESEGLVIISDYVFKGDAQALFPWTWVGVYEAVLRYFFPSFMCLMMLVQNEMKATKLDRYKGSLYSIGLLAMWLCTVLIKIASRICPGFSILHFIPFLPLMVIFPISTKTTVAPGGRSIRAYIVKALSSYVVPACIMGFIFGALYPVSKNHIVLFWFLSFVAAGLILLLVYGINALIQKSRFGHSTDYAAAFEKDLASVDYNGEMDDIADKMYKIFNKNTEASSMSVYINGGNDTFEPAYSSSGRPHKIAGKGLLLESLLNMGKNVVVWSELESTHSLSVLKEDLEVLFKETNSDALFILNEGRDVHGLITLGIKESKDHFKDYDRNVFTKLYSYFFVFGYYMRNVSNKEIIGTVNRELRMSSQIITSIQDNIDYLENRKLDAGCIMVPAHNIGGEFIDMIRLNDTRHLFVVGDLSGKGIAASMSMVILKQIIRAFLAETHDFKQLVVKVNSFIRDNLQKGTIFSGMFAIVDYEKDMFYYINCGIPAIFLYTEAYSNVIEIQGSGHILGFVKDLTPYVQVKSIQLHKNDIILACTDGLIKSHSIRGEEFGKDRITRYMVANSMYPAYRMAKFEHDELLKFMSHEMEDDVSVLVIKCLLTNESEKAEAEARKAELKASMMAAEEELVAANIHVSDLGVYDENRNEV